MFLCLPTAWDMPPDLGGGRGGGLVGVIEHLSDLSFRHVTTKIEAYFGKFAFFRKILAIKCTLSRSKPFLKIQWEINFWTFKNDDRNLEKKKKYEHFHFKSAFEINFRLREVIKLKIRRNGYFPIFSMTTSRHWKLISKADLK